uniref:Acetyltransferase n=1 Tax=Magnetococcus massalia (strain MO-1) TaxID=451514 RepID=A0A1S7LHL2_MAGMO
MEQLQVWSAGADNLESWHQRLNEQQTLLAFSYKQLVGFASLDITATLDLLFVHPDHQAQGVATKLLSSIESAALKQQVATLYADVSLTARPFFAKKGFQLIVQQQVVVRGMGFTNFKMHKQISAS